MWIIILVCLLVLVTLASSSQIQSEKNIPSGAPGHNGAPTRKRGRQKGDFSRIPVNYSFLLVWDAGGISSYDSASGRLISENNAGGAKRRRMRREEKKAIRQILSRLELSKFPENLKDGTACADNNRGLTILTLTVRCGRSVKTISGCPANQVGEAENARRGDYIDACTKIISIITQPGDLSALPVWG